MFDTETLLSLGLANQVISIWQVFLYIAAMVLCLLLQRVRLGLLITYLFAYYLAFLIYWGDYIANAGSMAPFLLYTFCGVAIVVLFMTASIYERPPKADDSGA